MGAVVDLAMFGFGAGDGPPIKECRDGVYLIATFVAMTFVISGFVVAAQIILQN